MSETASNKRYKGYDLEKKAARYNKNRPWFWKILGISLIITAVIIVAVLGALLFSTKKNANYMKELNASNTIDALLEGHENVTITCSYSHLSEGDDYTTTRQVRTDKKGNYYSYLKKEGTESDYKEVIKNKELYRNNGKYTQYFGLVGDDYEKTCVAEIEGSVYQANEKDKVKNEKERGNIITVQTTYTVQSGDDYEKTYGFSVGDEISKTIVMNKDTKIVTSEEEKCNEEVFYSYKVEFDGEKKIPKFYRAVQKEKETRVCTVYSNYNGEDNQEYTFNVPVDVYFTLLDHDGYTVYEDAGGSTEFGSYQMEIQNTQTDLTLYVKKAK